MQKLILGCLAMCSLINCLEAELVYAAVSGLPANFLPPPPFSGNIIHNMRTPHLQDGQLIRPQRSIYGPPIHGWPGPPVQPQSIGLGHISKQELITLLEAAKEAVRPEPEPAPVPEPEAGAGAESAPGGPPAGVPLTVSLPAFVPIQLSAMYTAPPPPGASQGAGGGAPQGGAGQEEEEEEGDDEEDEEEDEDEEEEEEEAEPEPETAPGPFKPYHPVYPPWSSQGIYNQRPAPSASSSPKRSRGKSAKTKSKSGSKSKSRKSKSKSKKSRSKKRNNNVRYAGSAQSPQALPPPPPFLVRPPPSLKLVPSNQLLSNWQ